MKKIFPYHFDWSWLTIAFFSLIVSFFVLVNIVQANYPGGGLTKKKIDINGWAWSPNIGWLSLNCKNDFDGDGDLDDNCSPTPYGLEIDESSDGTVRATGGCAWAGNVGWWICFDEPSDQPVSEPKTWAPTWGVYLNNYYQSTPTDLDPTADLVPNALFHGLNWSTEHSNGHASILPLEDVIGWNNELGFPIANSPVPSSIKGCFNCSETKTCSNNPNKNCTEDANCTSPGTCVTHKNCENCLQYNYNDDNPDILDSVVAGYQCNTCTFTSAGNCTENAYGRNENTCSFCGKYFNIPGLIVDYTTITNYGSMCGWAWNQDDLSHNGVGWIQFSPRITAGNNPYFQVNSGDIYAKGQIKNKNILAQNIYNAFLIETNSSITPLNIWASSTLATTWSKDRPLIAFPTLSSTGKYTNVLGSIDYNGLITEIDTITHKNKYGSVIDTNLNSTNWGYLQQGMDNFVFDNFVFSANSALTLASNEKLTISVAANKKGTGIVRIKGNVTINNNIEYTGDNNVNKLSDLPSVVWIIDGNLTISPSVTKLAGTFVVFGRFDTGADNVQLVVNGSVLAQAFTLGRTYSTNGEPAELFINDGRLKINPPAGLQNFASTLPKFSYQ